MWQRWLGIGFLLASLGATRARAETPLGGVVAAVRGGGCAGLTLTWTAGAAGLGGETARLGLRCEAGGVLAGGDRCRAEPCPAPVPTLPTVPLTAGQRERLLSGLRSVGLQALRPTADQVAAADRRLALRWQGQPAGTFALPLGDWPVPPGGADAGLAAFLDELSASVQKAQGARPALVLPKTAAELAGYRLQLRLMPAELVAGAALRRPADAGPPKPTGLLVVGEGAVELRRDPPPGGLAAVRREGRVARAPLAPASAAALLRALEGAQLDTLGDKIPRREGLAVDDKDGRVATLTLFLPTGAAPSGVQRPLADLLASPAGPLVRELLALWDAAPKDPR